MEPLKGRHGTYVLIDKLGAGGNGEVWRAMGPSGEVAIKLLKGRARPGDAAPRFVREVSILGKLAGKSGILPMLDADPEPVEARSMWFAMPIATLLRSKLGANPGLVEVCRAFSAIALTLGQVHALDVSHRDIKPDNLYFHADTWCLGDFGLADFDGADPITTSDHKLGPAYYIAPEMLNSATSADGRLADVYSLGKTIWVLATGQNYPLPGMHDPTFTGASIATYRSETIAPRLDELLRHMTQLDPLRRISAASASNELAILCQERPSMTPPSPEAALERLRGALVPHVGEAQETERQQVMAQETVRELEAAVEDVIQTIEDTTDFDRTAWYSMPIHWGPRPSHRGARVTWESEQGHAFEVGGFTKWRLGIGCKCQLLSDGTLFMHVGYHYDRLIAGRESNTVGGPQGWHKHREAPNGAPSCDQAVADLLAEFKQQLPATIDTFTELIRKLPK